MGQFTIKSASGKLILFSTILASGMAFLDGTVVNIAIPSLQKSFHASISDIQWVINSYSLMLCALILISGAMGDKFGRKKIFSSGILVFTVASLLCGLSQSINQLALFRGLQGIGGAMMVPGSLSIIDNSFEDSIRGRAIGIWSGFAGGISALGPFVGGWLVQNLGWPSIFFINLPLGVLAFFVTLKFVPESKSSNERSLDFLGTVLIFFSLLGVAYGLISGPELGWTNPAIIGSLGLGGLLFIGFLVAEMKSKNPLVPLNIFKSGLVTGANLVTLFLYFALSGVVFFLVLNFQQIQHYSPIMAGLGILPAVLIITFFSGVGGSIADKSGPRIPMILGPLVVAFGMTILALTGKNANYFWQYLPALVLFGFGMSLVIAPLTKTALEVSPNYSGAASGINNAVARVAGLLAVALLGAIVLSIFQKDLGFKISNLPISATEKISITNQQNKMAGIEIPENFSSSSKQTIQTSIDDSFMNGFHWAMWINASLAFLSAAIAYVTIHPKK